MGNQNERAQLKQRQERNIGDWFLQATEPTAVFTRHGDAARREPDVVYTISGRRLGVEVTVAYYDNAQAKVQRQLDQGEVRPGPNGVTKLGFWFGPDERIEAAVRRLLSEKCRKAYAMVDRLWLCIYLDAPLAEDSEAQILVALVRVPKPSPFERVFLGYHADVSDGGGFRVFELRTWRPDGCDLRCRFSGLQGFS